MTSLEIGGCRMGFSQVLLPLQDLLYCDADVSNMFYLLPI
jgi:hypothetical protein